MDARSFWRRYRSMGISFNERFSNDIVELNIIKPVFKERKSQGFIYIIRLSNRHYVSARKGKKRVVWRDEFGRKRWGGRGQFIDEDAVLDTSSGGLLIDKLERPFGCERAGKLEDSSIRECWIERMKGGVSPMNVLEELRFMLDEGGYPLKSKLQKVLNGESEKILRHEHLKGSCSLCLIRRSFP